MPEGPAPLFERIYRWLARLLLLLLAVCGLLVLWICLDDDEGVDLLSVIATALASLVSVAIALWAWGIWSKEV
jgi:hypothetical protein